MCQNHLRIPSEQGAVRPKSLIVLSSGVFDLSFIFFFSVLKVFRISGFEYWTFFHIFPVFSKPQQLFCFASILGFIILNISLIGISLISASATHLLKLAFFAGLRWPRICLNN